MKRLRSVYNSLFNWLHKKGTAEPKLFFWGMIFLIFAVYSNIEIVLLDGRFRGNPGRNPTKLWEWILIYFTVLSMIMAGLRPKSTLGRLGMIIWKFHIWIWVTVTSKKK